MTKRRDGEIPLKKLWDEDPAKTQLKKNKRRAIILIITISFCFVVIFIRLIDLMIFRHDTLSQRAKLQYIRIKTLKPQRGIIRDRRMREMAINIKVDSLFIVPSEVKDVKTLSSHLAPIINISAEQLNRILLEKKEKDFIWLLRKMDKDTAHNVRALKNQLGYRELGFLTESKRYYPKGQTASHVLGYTDIDNEGLEGIELEYNEYMKGEVKKVLLTADAYGNSLSEGVKESVAGNNVLLTIDESLQYIVERELANAVAKWEAKAAVGIMMNPMTGEILAMANNPTYDPNFPGRAHDYERRNRAITDIYEPGSTLKTFLAAAALEEGVVKLNDEFDVSKGFITIAGKSIHDPHKHKILTFQDIIQKSSNVGAVQIGLKLGKERYYKYIKKFGFGEKTGIDLPGEVRGILREPKDWSGTSLAALSIGHEIGVTPLQVLRAYSAIANGGILMRPYIVSEIISPTGKVVKRTSPKIGRRVISRATAKVITEILKTVVEEGGTAHRAYIKGNLVAGKTGTAQMVDPETGRYSRDKYVSSFVGFVPADNPKIALIVVIYEPKGAVYGGTVAAPVFKNIIEHALTYLNIPMEKDENHILLVSK
jgi:cell division protein FtsI (penicillin-binding protein 3)